MSKRNIQRARRTFWILWTLLITLPVDLAALIFSRGAWWASTIAVVICTVLGYNIFEFWLKRRQLRADNTVVLCECAHPLESHDIGTYACWYDDGKRIRKSKSAALGCLCLRYAPRFWQMSERT